MFMRSLCGMVAAALVLSACGCNSGPTRKALSTVETSFKVTLNGTPVDEAMITLNPDTKGQGVLATGNTGKDGTAKIKVVPGNYTVVVTKMPNLNPIRGMGASKQDQEKFQNMPSADSVSEVPVVYTKVGTTPFKISVPDTGGEYPLAMTGEPPNKGGNKKQPKKEGADKGKAGKP